MNTPDELEQLWKTQPVDPAVKGEEMRNIILKKSANFDRTIRWRNIRETVAALAVAAFFAYIASKQHNAIERAGSVILVASSFWIVFYMWRHKAAPSDPNPGQTLVGYQRALAGKYDNEIRLLRNVKFWYLLPMYVGLLTLTAGLWKERAAMGALTWRDAIGPIAYTLIFAVIWWANEVWAVRKLERVRAKLMAGGEEIGTPC